MQVKVIKKSEKTACQCEVIQLNEVPQPASDLEAIPKWIEEGISVLVPTRFSSVTCQIDENSRIRLEACYGNSILFAFKEGFDSIQIPDLGVENLYWDSVESAGAARNAIVKVFDSVPEDFLVVFSVPEDEFEIWDGVMTF